MAEEKQPTWRNHLLAASFREVPFHVLDTSTEVGRRNVIHQYPFQDEPYVEDLGLDADQFRVTGYVVQNAGNQMDYFAERDALLAALRAAGPGTLVHPFLGEFTVALSGRAQMTESFREGGIARFQMLFVRAGANIFPQATVDHIHEVNAASEEALDSFSDKLLKALDWEGPDFLRSDFITDVKAGYTTLKNTIGAVQGFTTTVRGNVMGTIDTALGDISGLIGNSLSIFDNIRSTFTVFDDIMDGLENIAYIYGWSGDSGTSASARRGSTGVSVVRAALSVATGYGDGLTAIGQTTDTRTTQQENRELLIAAFRSNALLSAARASVRARYSSADEAIEVMSEIIDVLDGHLGYLADTVQDDEAYSLMDGLRPKVVDAMIAMGASLAPVLYYTMPPEPMPLLRLAYEQYEDLDREVDIFDRNIPIIQHPGFPPGGKQIEILLE